MAHGGTLTASCSAGATPTLNFVNDTGAPNVQGSSSLDMTFKPTF